MEENAEAKKGMRRARERITWGLRCELEWDPQLGRKTSQEDAEQREEVPRGVRECAWGGLSGISYRPTDNVFGNCPRTLTAAACAPAMAVGAAFGVLSAWAGGALTFDRTEIGHTARRPSVACMNTSTIPSGFVLE